MGKVTNVLLVGVGGQGTIMVSTVLTHGLIEAGYDVKMSEVHGMAQRGGSVTTQVRFGETVYSPIIGRGQGDVLTAFETMEALRILEALKPDGKVIVNDYRIPPMPVIAGEAPYPEGLIGILQKAADTSVIDAASIAGKLGNTKVMNVVLLGALLKVLNLAEIDWESILKRVIKPQFFDVNLQALRAGMAAV
ncbi:MAG: indolepyruvate oxidoreductase subunit beta [Synergistaceae bacterium]|jgi:indolepyruvate ferredoxin oxidoreductase beta subunit|nr:indolepyruvate oxidoreductase subunit beta [Synergistaceae bacterium]